MIRTIISAVLLASASSVRAYEKIEFQSMVQSPALQRPSAVAVAQGRIFVADSKANAVFVFDAEGKQLGKMEGGIKSPEAVAFGDGRLYVADTGNSRVAVFDAESKLLWTFSSGGSDPGQLKSPEGIAYGPDDRVYVSNTGNSRVEVFNADGIYLYGFPVAKQDGTARLQPAKISLNRAGDILVSDPDKGVLQRYDRSGKLLKEYGMPNNGAAFDRYGFAYAINAKDGKVMELSETGEKVGTFGTRGKGKSEFRNLCDIAIDKNGTLYLCDSDNRKVVLIKVETAYKGPRLKEAAILDRFTAKGPSAKFPHEADVFTAVPGGKVIAWMPKARELDLFDGETKKTLVREGKLQGQLRSPRGIFVGKGGKIYVADTGNDRVQIFNADGTYDNMFGDSGSGEGEFRSPSSIAVNSLGNIYVADTKNKMIKAFSGDGMFMFAKGPQLGNVALESPVSVVCDENKNLYVLDSKLKKVIVLDSMGKFLKLWDDSGSLQDPASLAYDGKGFFYILDKGAFNVKIFDANGKFTASFFARGRGERELWEPEAMSFADDRIYVSDPAMSRVLAFDISYLPEEPAALSGKAGDKDVKLAWKAGTNAWTKGFKVYRAVGAGGDTEEIGSAQDMSFEDSSLTPDTTYYYYAAALSVSGMQGGLSAPAEVYYKGPKAPEKPAAAPAAANKNVAPMEIEPTELNFIFSANYKYYQKNPVGKVTVKNNTDTDFSNVKLSFNFKDFMDFPSDTVVPEVKARSQAEVPLSAVLNNRILSIVEDTPIQCQLTLTYYQDGAEKTFTLNQPVKVLSKNAIVWDNPARLANFITVKDGPVMSFRASALRDKKELSEGQDINDSLLDALMVWETVGEMGVTYMADPVSPYSSVKSTSAPVLDTVQFPRNTMKLKSGDCDDLTALFATLFEAAGLHTALLDLPGHIAIMFDTGKTDANEVGIPEEYLIKHDNTLWVGVETTMVGKSFYDAVVSAAELYRKTQADAHVIDVREALTQFEPVTLPESEGDKFEYPGLAARVKTAIEALAQARYDYLKKYYGAILQENPDDTGAALNLGILHAGYRDYDSADASFAKVLAREPYNAGALNDMGSLRYLQKKYDEAQDYFFKASKADPADAGIWLNLARNAARMGKKEDAKVFADKAVKLDGSQSEVAKLIAK